MLRSLILAILFVASANASAIWPEQLGKFHRVSAKPYAFDITVDREYGFEQTEDADYGSFKVSASRYKDSTGAFAAALAKPEHPIQVGNYVITCSGKCPKSLAKDVEVLPGLSRAPLPSIGGYLPASNRIARSERYILGPISLQESAPQIPAAAVAFQFGTEGELARYKMPAGEATLAIFAYPTPQIARQQVPAFQSAGGVVKRTGPLVSVALSADRATAQNLLAEVKYQGSISWDDPPPLVMKPATAGQMLMSIITLAGIVLGFCLTAGLAFGALRVVSRRFGYSDAGTSMTTLHLSGK